MSRLQKPCGHRMQSTAWRSMSCVGAGGGTTFIMPCFPTAEGTPDTPAPLPRAHSPPSRRRPALGRRWPRGRRRSPSWCQHGRPARRRAGERSLCGASAAGAARHRTLALLTASMPPIGVPFSYAPGYPLAAMTTVSAGAAAHCSRVPARLPPAASRSAASRSDSSLIMRHWHSGSPKRTLCSSSFACERATARMAAAGVGCVQPCGLAMTGAARPVELAGPAAHPAVLDHEAGKQDAAERHAAVDHCVSGALHDVPHHLGLHVGGDNGRRRVGAHAARVRPRVALADGLVVLHERAAGREQADAQAGSLPEPLDNSAPERRRAPRTSSRPRAQRRTPPLRPEILLRSTRCLHMTPSAAAGSFIRKRVGPAHKLLGQRGFRKALVLGSRNAVLLTHVLRPQRAAARLVCRLYYAAAVCCAACRRPVP